MTERSEDDAGAREDQDRGSDDAQNDDAAQDDTRERDRDAALELAEKDETVSDSNTCPECEEPVHNLRATCPNCGHEYDDSERDDDEAGTEFAAGTEIPDEEKGDALSGSSDDTPRAVQDAETDEETSADGEDARET